MKIHSQDRVRNVVVFFSYGPNLPAFEKVLDGLNSTIRGKTGEPVNLLTEYLDMNRVQNDDYSKFIINTYNERLTDITIDLLITVGPGINDALQKYGSAELRSTNIISIDLDIPGRTSLEDLGIQNGKEILLKFKPAETLRHAFDLFPDNKDVFVISGISGLDRFFTSLTRKGTVEFEPDHNFQFITNLTLDSTIRLVRTIPSNSIVVVPAYLQDASSVSFSTPEIMEMISKASSAPVFLGITDGGFSGQGGGIGGYLFNYRKLGEETGRIAQRTLNGEPLLNVDVEPDALYEHMYDWDQLERWNLTNSKIIPANSVFYNKSVSLLTSYKWYIMGVVAFIISQSVLIVYLFRLNRRQKSITGKMKLTEGMHRELTHTDRLSKMSMLTASLSHELFQPLAAIRFTAQAGKQFILTNKFDLNKASEMFDHIIEDETRATQLIRNVRSMMKTGATEKGPVCLNAVINDTIDLVRTEAEGNSTRIRITSKADAVYVIGDKVQLQQVLMNFTRNAFNAMEKNGPREKFLDIVLDSNGHDAVVSVRDSGPGLDPTVKENLFKPFVSTKKEGFGIGLTLCRSLIENHSGKITAENARDGGAVFAFSIPLMK